jgi:hypothetical protein
MLKNNKSYQEDFESKNRSPVKRCVCQICGYVFIGNMTRKCICKECAPEDQREAKR